MSELTNQPDFDDSLLSAYVDGELTTDERAVVEARLAEDPQARQLVADLKRVSEQVRSLPRAKVTEDVRVGVFQQLDGPAIPVQPSTLTMRRRLLWPLLATAALVMLMFYQPEENEVEVVLVDKIQNNKEPTKAKNESAPQAASGLKALGEIPEADTSGSPIAAAPSGERSDLKRKMTADSAVALGIGGAAGSLVTPESNVGLVHITLTDLRSGAEHFDRLLVSNGIQLVDESVEEKVAETGDREATFRDSSLFADSRGGGVGGSANSSEPSEADAEASFEGKAQPSGVEMVLVEAPPEQLAKFLFACNQDNEAIESLTIDELANAVSGVQPSEQLEHYRQYEKPTRQQSAAQNYTVTPEQQGVIAALNSLDLPSVGPASAGLQQNQAWATKLRPHQASSELKQLENQIQSRRNQDPGEKQRSLAKKDADSPQQMRVLFLLHPSETSKK